MVTCRSRVVVDFDCGCGLLACLLAVITHPVSSSSSSPNPAPSPGPCVRAVCCHEDISNGCFEALHKNTSHWGQGLGPGLGLEQRLESSVTITAAASTATAATTATSSSSTTAAAAVSVNGSAGSITLHEYHHQGTGLAPGSAPGPGLGPSLALDRCPAELVVGADTIVLRMETFMRSTAGSDDSHGHNTSHPSGGAGAADHAHNHNHSHGHLKGKSHGHSDHSSTHPPSSASSVSFSPSSSLKNLQHFCSSLFVNGGDGAASTGSTITTVLLAIQVGDSPARSFIYYHSDPIILH